MSTNQYKHTENSYVQRPHVYIYININIQETTIYNALMYADQYKHTENSYVQRPHVYISI